MIKQRQKLGISFGFLQEHFKRSRQKGALKMKTYVPKKT